MIKSTFQMNSMENITFRMIIPIVRGRLKDLPAQVANIEIVKE